ncbi:MAG: 30S ribosomal protein S2 [Candidatus Kerfeldbacteria bacterium]|nr:30S ribosomal protein S2 [Candidatus Kerfeldbacteria bacterium]
MREISLAELLKAGVHFGHQVSRWHPKMRPFIFTSRSGIYIIDLEKTSAALKRAQQFVRERALAGGVVLFVGTKRQARAIVQSAAVKLGMPYVVERWLGGTFTNFPTITKMTKRLSQLKAERAHGGFAKYTKKEQLQFDDEISRLERMVGGIERMERLPDAVFIVDLKQEKTAVREARKMKIPMMAITDTNVSPEGIDYPIPGNDDATKSIQIITDAIAEAAGEGKAEWEARAKEGVVTALDTKVPSEKIAKPDEVPGIEKQEAIV